MDDNNENDNLYWSDEKEYGYEEVFTSQGLQINHSFEAGNQSNINDQEFQLLPEVNQHGEGDGGSSSSSETTSPLGLTLHKTPSFLTLLQRSLFNGKQPDVSTTANEPSHRDNKPRSKWDDLGSQSMSEKLKASNFPAISMKIGTWKRFSRHEGDLTAKLYYAKRKLVWEVLDGALKNKIEVQWSDISAIKAVMPENQPGILAIELSQPPLFYRETDPQPRKHTLWHQTSDFTGGQAPIWRIHQVTFSPGTLDRHYEKLLQCDQRLTALSQQPFPSHESPFFNPAMFQISPHSTNFTGYYGSSSSGYLFQPPQYPFHATYHAPASRPPLPFQSIPIQNPNISPFANAGGGYIGHFAPQMRPPWGDQGANFFGGNTNVIMSGDNNRVFNPQSGNSNQPDFLLPNAFASCGFEQPQMIMPSDEETFLPNVDWMRNPVLDNPVDARAADGHAGMVQIDGHDNQMMMQSNVVGGHEDQVMMQGNVVGGMEPVNWMIPQEYSTINNNNEENVNKVREQNVNISDDNVNYNLINPFEFPGDPSGGDCFSNHRNM